MNSNLKKSVRKRETIEVRRGGSRESSGLAEARREFEQNQAARKHLHDTIRSKELKFRELEQTIGNRKNVFGDVLEEKATSTKNLLENSKIHYNEQNAINIEKNNKVFEIDPSKNKMIYSTIAMRQNRNINMSSQ